MVWEVSVHIEVSGAGGWEKKKTHNKMQNSWFGPKFDPDYPETRTSCESGGYRIHTVPGTTGMPILTLSMLR